jgi:hypothetical protein
MGIDLRWEDEKGNTLAELPDGNFLIEKFLPDFEDKEFPVFVLLTHLVTQPSINFK